MLALRDHHPRVQNFAQNVELARREEWGNLLTLVTTFSTTVPSLPEEVSAESIEESAAKLLEGYFSEAAVPEEMTMLPGKLSMTLLKGGAVLRKREDLFRVVLEQLTPDKPMRVLCDLLLAFSGLCLDDDGREFVRGEGKVLEKVVDILERIVEERAEDKGEPEFKMFPIMGIEAEDLGQELHWISEEIEGSGECRVLIPEFVCAVVGACFVLSNAANPRSAERNARRLVPILGGMLGKERPDSNTRGRGKEGELKDWSVLIRAASLEAILGIAEAEAHRDPFCANGSFIGGFRKHPGTLEIIAKLLTKTTHEEVHLTLNIIPHFFAHCRLYWFASVLLTTLHDYASSKPSVVVRELGLRALLRSLEANAFKNSQRSVDFDLLDRVAVFPGAIPFFIPLEYHRPWMPTLLQIFQLVLKSDRDGVIAKSFREQHPCVHKTLVTILKRSDSDSLRTQASELLKFFDPMFRSSGTPDPSLSQSKSTTSQLTLPSTGHRLFLSPGKVRGDLNDCEEVDMTKPPIQFATLYENSFEEMLGIRPQKKPIKPAEPGPFYNGRLKKWIYPKKRLPPLEEGRKLFTKGKLEEAKNEFRHALKSENLDTSARAAANLSLVCLKLGDTDDAIKYATWPSVVDYEPMKEKLQLRLALAYEATGEDDLIQKALTIARSLTRTKAVQELCERLSEEIPEED